MKIVKFYLKCEVNLRAASGVSTVLIIVTVVAVCAANILLSPLVDNLSLGDESLGVFDLPDEAAEREPGLDTDTGHHQDQNSYYKTWTLGQTR